MHLDITESELQEQYEKVLTTLGAWSIDVDVTKVETMIMLKWGLQEFEKETSMWQLRNQFGNIYGTTAGIIQQNQLATMNFSLIQQVSDWFASMSRTGGKIPWHKDYILLEPGRQIYDLSKESSKPYPPGSRRIHRVMWVAKPEILQTQRFSAGNPNGDDILYSTAWNFSGNGLNFGGSPLAYLGYSFDTILMMQSMEMRNKILFSEFFHNLSGDILELTPTPGVGASAFAPGLKVFYYYWDESEVILNGRNPNLSEDSEAIESFTSSTTGIPSSASNLIANPIDFKIDYILWSSLSPWAKTWIFDFCLAKCKYIQGSKWRKIKKTFATGEMEYEIDFDYQSLLNESEQEIERLTQSLRDDLKEIDVVKMFQDKAEIAIAAGKVSTRVPRLWSFMTTIGILIGLFLL